MKWWIFIGCLLPLLSQANQMAIEVIEGAYPKLTLRLEQVDSLELAQVRSLMSVSEPASVVSISLAATKACVAEQLLPLRGRLQVVELAWSRVIQQRLEQLEAQTWPHLALRIAVISNNERCSTQDLRLLFPTIQQLSQGWGRFSLSPQGAVELHGFVVMQQVATSLFLSP